MAGVWGSTTNCGQYCSSVQRIYVHESIYDKLVEKVVEITKQIRVGNGLNPNIDMGPLVNQQQFSIVLNQIEDALCKGAKILFGGHPYLEGEFSKGYFMQPTVMIDLNHDMEIMKKETFGPVIRIMKFSDVEEAIELVNDSEYGLGAAVITQDNDKAEYIASRLDVGMVWINEPLLSMASCPWIARKNSGLGYELGQLGVLEFVKPKLVSSQYTGNEQKRVWWYPY